MGGDGGKPMLGGAKDVSVDEPEVKKAAEFAVQQLAGQSNSLVPPKLKEVIPALVPLSAASCLIGIRYLNWSSPGALLLIREWLGVLKYQRCSQLRCGPAARIGADISLPPRTSMQCQHLLGFCTTHLLNLDHPLA